MKALFILHMRDIIHTKVWNPSCVRVVPCPISGKLQNISCTFDTGNKTCLLCAAFEARDRIQKEQKDKNVFPVPLYTEIIPFFIATCKSLFGVSHKSLTLWQAEQVIVQLEKSSISF
jgi:hypothetical protein